ncbi:MAG: sulfite exporter TauE/SafE family protein [Bdellovibrionales bacterium]|nr:sulfite exporter TauE/SafE family protein [Bdellovibrionales bacterium]
MAIATDFPSISLVALFTASLLGGAHCVGMCGGIVLLYSQSNEQRLKSHAAYNVGRLNSYLLLGALAGFLGKSLNLASSAAGIGRWASVVFGAFLIVWGVFILINRRNPEVPLPGGGRIRELYKLLGSDTGFLPNPVRAYVLGLLSTLLPCGWLYSFAAIAAASGGVISGMVVMLAFWLGTLPYMVSVGVASQALLGPFKRHLPVITGLLVCVAGIFSVGMHFRAFDSVAVLGEVDMVSEAHCH